MFARVPKHILVKVNNSLFYKLLNTQKNAVFWQFLFLSNIIRLAQLTCHYIGGFNIVFMFLKGTVYWKRRIQCERLWTKKVSAIGFKSWAQTFWPILQFNFSFMSAWNRLKKSSLQTIAVVCRLLQSSADYCSRLQTVAAVCRLLPYF